MENANKKRLITFIIVAYGVAAIMWIFMAIGLKSGKDLTAFVNAQMFYPACGVMLGFLLFGDKEKKLPKAGFIVALITAAVMIIVSIISAFAEHTMITTAAGTVSNWNLYTQYIMIVGSIICYILFWACGREKRRNAGLCRNNIKTSVILVFVFVALYILRVYISVFLSGLVNNDASASVGQINQILSNPQIIISAFVILINFPLTFLAFWGEEYGWRYYLQGILQKKFGLRLGVLILGVVWGLWHFGLDMMFYTTTTGPVYLISQIITCISLGIFFGYVYMKTQNIWVVALMHFINNNYVVLFSGGDVNVLQNQTVTLSDIPLQIISCLLYMAFILAPIYSGKKKEKIEIQ